MGSRAGTLMRRNLHLKNRAGFLRAALAAAATFCAGLVLGLLLHSRDATSTSRQEPKAFAQTTASPLGASARLNAHPKSDAAPDAASALNQLRTLVTSRTPIDLLEALSLIRALPASDCKAALQIVRRTSGENIRPMIDALARRWAELDPMEAFSAAQRERDNDIRNRIGFAAGAALAARDPEAALQQITAARNNDDRVKAAEWVLPALAKHDPQRAADDLVSR